MNEVARPYFRVSVIAGEAVTEGSADVLFGHRIDDGARPNGGNWVEWRWDGQELSVTNDLFGAYPVYYAASGTTFAISPSIDRLLALGVDRELDLDALAAFLTVGHYYGTDSPFRAIRALPPACRLTWRRGALSIEDAPARFTIDDMTREQATEGVITLMRQAVARRIPDAEADYIIPLSGGRDSRHILLELLRQGHRPRLCVTAEHYPYDWGGDVPYAARLASELGLEHAVVRPGPPVAAEQRKNRLTSYASTMHA
ncbi:MAG: asparagine synthetase B family protein, partial [Chloroflexota bacterium]